MTQANHPAFVRLATLGVTTVTGKDALTFLHGQVTNRLQPIGKRAPLAGYCSPKGRLLATMRVWAEGDKLSLLLPKSVEPAFLKRIRMYVLRADVQFAADEDRTLPGIDLDALDARDGGRGLDRLYALYLDEDVGPDTFNRIDAGALRVFRQLFPVGVHASLGVDPHIVVIV